MSEREWHYVHQRTREGPIPESVLRTRFQNAELPLDVLVWCETLDDWVVAHEEPAFRNIKVQPRPAAPASAAAPARRPTVAPPPAKHAAPAPQQTQNPPRPLTSPPPLQPASRIPHLYVYRPTGNAGPYSRDDIAQMYASGALRPSDVLWREGLAAWTPVTVLLGVPASQPPSSAPHAQPQPLPQNVTPNQSEGIGRLVYIFYFFLMMVAASNYSGPGPASPLVLLLVCAFSLLVIERRICNLGYSSWWTLLALIPIINLVVLLPCAFAPAGYARHRAVDTAGIVIITLMSAFFALYLFGMYGLGHSPLPHAR